MFCVGCLVKYLCGTCGKSGRQCSCGLVDGWFIRDLASRPEMIAKWKRMTTATHNSVGYPLADSQRIFAQSIIRKLEDYMGQAL